MLSDHDLLNILKTHIEPGDDDGTLFTYLNDAKERILDKLYPFSDQERVMPSRYQTLQIEIAVYLLNKRGAEGQTTHRENGVNRTYENAEVPRELLNRITPFVGVIQ